MLLAYIDPGAGSLVIQALIAGALAIPFFFRSAVTGTLARLRGGTRRTAPDDTTPDSR